MRKSQRWILSLLVALALAALILNFSPIASSQGEPEAATGRGPVTRQRQFENFDIRVRQPKKTESSETLTTGAGKLSQLTLETLKPRPVSAAQAARTATIIQSMRAAQEQLASRLPNLRVEFNETVRVPEIVRVEGGGALAAPAAANAKLGKEYTLHGFLTENAALYGLTSAQVDQLTKVSDYTNPAGNLSFVEFQQEVNGIPVFQGYLRGILAADGRLVRTTGLLAAGVRASALSTAPTLGATSALAAAAASIKVAVDADSLTVLEQGANGRTQTVSQGPFDENTKIELVYFPLAPGQMTLAYSMVLWQPNDAYYVLVDAQTGMLLWRKNITQDQTQTVTYNIYNNDSPTPSSPTACTGPTPCVLPPGITRTDVTVISENAAADNLGWIPDGAGNAVTTGNNCDAGIDRDGSNGIDAAGRATATGRTFNFLYIPDGAADPTGTTTVTNTAYQMGVVTNIFFWTNRYHDLMYDFGFTEPAGNFQTNNFSRGGLGNDFVRAEAQDSSSTNNANFSTPADGQLPRMQMFLFTTTPNRDGDLDAEVFIHEMTHGLSNRLHGNATGLGSNESGGMGEGWSDYYARALRADASENVDGLYASGGYVTKNYYYGIRRFPYAIRANIGPNGKPHNPTTFADTDPAQIDLSDGAFAPAFVGAANEVHNIGDVWANILFEMRANLIHQLGFATGNPRSIQIVTDGMKLDPVNPTMVDARNSILAANCAGFAGANELDIWQGFSVHGMGFRAGYQLGADGLVHVLESFAGPNLTLGNVVPTEITGNGNGQFDPGETVSLSIPLSNTLCATNAITTTATLSPGGGVGSYGTINAGGNGTQAVTVTIPTSTACGSSLPITITVNSTNLGPIVYTYNLPIGQRAPLSAYENFDAVTAPALPTGWTTSHSGAGLGWVTATVNADTAPNSAATADQANEGTNSLTSPMIPINTALAQLSFRNVYNLEDGFDAMTLQIKIGSGPFQDIIVAGGSFVSGGYNLNIGWTGLSGGTTATPTYITTVVNLPASANGQFVQFRWTVHSDANTIAAGQAGASIDTIQLSTAALACSTFGAATVSISGKVTDGSLVGLNGIQLALSGTTNVTTITNATGNYSFTGLVSGGNYTVTPTTPGLEYTPANRVFNSLVANAPNADFVAIPAAGIAGRVINGGGAGIDGVTVTLSGSSAAVTTTAGGGFYAFSPLTRFGNYTVTPSGGVNNTFTPPNRTYNSLNSAVTDANFTAFENVACAPIGSIISGSIAAGDTTQTNRLLRDGIPSTCANKAFPGESAVATIRYDTQTFVNGPSPACIKVSFAANFAAHSAVYQTSYDPANKNVNFLGDSGTAYAGNNSTASYMVNVPASATYVVVVTETALGVGGNYTLALCNSSAAPPPAAPAATRGQVLISEFRQSVGSTTSSNEYVELYNNTDAPISVGGYGLAVFNATFGGDVVLGFPAAAVIPRRGHLLIANTAGYSLTAYAAGDLTHANANLMPDNQGFGLIDAARATLIDSVGFAGNSGALPYIEGVGLRTTLGARPNIEHAWVRKIDPNTSLPIDTDNNLNDFQLVSVTGAPFNTSTTPIQSFLGAPGPENGGSPVQGFAISAGFVDPGCSGAGPSGSACSLTRDPTPIDATSTLGTISIRRKLTNNTGAPVTRLRFRVINDSTTTLPVPPGTADLRLRSSSTITANLNAGGTTTIEGLTLENPPAQASGGGSNSSVSAGSIALATPLAVGGSINVDFDFGVLQTGNFQLTFVIEGLPAGGSQFGAAGVINGPTSSNASIAGAVTDGSGKPLPGVVIGLTGAQSRRTITDASGNYRFDNVTDGGFYIVTPTLANYHFSPGNRSFSVVGNQTEAVFTAAADEVATANAIDSNEFFVWQHYRDFLGREPDAGGLAYWVGKLDQCGGDGGCLRTARIDVSAAFFQSIEFGKTGGYIYRLYEAGLGRQLSYGEFAVDRPQVVGGANLDEAKTAFANAFISRPEFAQKYQGQTTGAAFVDALLQSLRDSAGVDLASERPNLLNRYNEGGTMNEGRALVLREVGENASFASAAYNRAFVLMEYFGYLRRGAEPQGNDFWLQVLNNNGGDYRAMVCSFLTSFEYQYRFGPVVTHSNSECGR